MLADASQAELEADAERGKLLPSLSGEGRRHILARRRKDAARRRAQSGMARKKVSRRRPSDRLNMGVSTGVSNISLHVSKGEENEMEGDPADFLAEDLVESIQQVAPPMLTNAAESLRNNVLNTGVAAMENLRNTELLDVKRMDDLDAGGTENGLSDQQQAQLRWRSASRCV